MADIERMDEMAQETTERALIPDHLTPRYAVIQTCIDAGMKQVDIAKGIGKSRATITHCKNNLQRKYDLTSTKYVKLASDVVKNTLKGKCTGDVTDIKASTVLQAAQMVYDRAQPAVTINQNLNLNVSLSPEDEDRLASKYRKVG